MKVLWLTNVPSPYRVDFFNELGKRCDLTVGFEKNTSDERDASWKEYKFEHFKGIILKGKSIATDRAICLGVVNLIKQCHYDEIVVTNISSPTGILAVYVLKQLKQSYWVEGDGAFVNCQKGLKESLKKRIISGAKGCFSTGKSHDAYYQKYGARKSNIFRYPFTSLRQEDIYSEVPSKQEKDEYRRQLGIKENIIILTVGRFSYLKGYGKGYDVLIHAASKMNKDFGWYIVGGEPTEEFIRKKEDANLSNVHFIRYLDKNELGKFYRASDLFVLMTVNDVWGLVVNEAMAHGLPVITTDRCGAGLELVTEDENGYIVPVGDNESLSRSIERIVNGSLCIKMGQNSIDRINNYTIEQMAIRHMEIFENSNKKSMES